MSSQPSMLPWDEELEEIKKEISFSHRETGTLSQEDFLRIPELVIDPLGDQIINAFFPEGEDGVNFRGFTQTLAHFRPIEDNKKSKDVNGPEPLNSRSNKLHFFDKDDKLSRDELIQVLEKVDVEQKMSI
uniref:EF-hand domain-containing protein n=1 Tax=Rhinopithecus roxellana TaxID=61622 RepID=A0A2K6PPR3_RHIRO